MWNQQYKVRCTAHGAAGVQRFDVHYNGKGEVTSVAAVGKSLDENEERLVLAKAKAFVQRWRESRLLEGLTDEQRAKLTLVLGAAAESFVDEVRPVSVAAYEVRITVGAATIAVFHNANGRWTKALPIGADAPASELSEALKKMLTDLNSRGREGDTGTKKR